MCSRKKHMVSRQEMLALIPLSSLALVYWIRDQYLYNKSRHICVFTDTQLKVLALYPLWVFSEFAKGVQMSNRSYIVFVTTLSSFALGHYTTVAIVNDSFYMSRQQVYSMFWGVLIAYTWTIYGLLQFGQKEDEVNDIHHCDCEGEHGTTNI